MNMILMRSPIRGIVLRLIRTGANWPTIRHTHRFTRKRILVDDLFHRAQADQILRVVSHALGTLRGIPRHISRCPVNTLIGAATLLVTGISRGRHTEPLTGLIHPIRETALTVIDV